MTQIQPTIHQVGRLVQLLAVATHDTTVRPRGNLVQPALIAQLRSNISPDGAGAPGSKKAARERITLNAAALDLYRRVERQIAREYQKATDKDAVGSPEQLLVSWYVQFAMAYADHDLVDAQISHAYGWLDEQRTLIMDHFHPPEIGTVWESPGRPAECPECGWAWVTITTTDGPVSKGALAILSRPWRGETTVQCRRHPDHTWTGSTTEELRDIARLLGINTIAVIPQGSES